MLDEQPTFETARAAAALALAGDAVVVADGDGRVVLFNRAAEALFGYAAAEALGLPVEVLLPERLDCPHREPTGPFARGIGPTWRVPGGRRETTGRRRDGGEFLVEATLSYQDLDGEAVLIIVARDITEREQARRAERLRVRETEHRLKNVLATVQALVVHSSHDSPSPEAFVNAFSSRLAALADVHALLIESRWEGAPLRELVLRQLAPYRSAGRENTIAGEAVALGPEAALALNAVLHELATNAAKHGALSVPSGRVEVLWRIEDGPEGRHLVLKWAELGGPPVRPPARRGFGRRLIERGFAHELGGMARLEFPPQGVRCRIELPLDPVLPRWRPAARTSPGPGLSEATPHGARARPAA